MGRPVQALKIIVSVALLLEFGIALPQKMDFTAVRAEVDFSHNLRDWDGFGFNYVEVAQSLDYNADPQEYGGFSLLQEGERQKILEMIFGPEGLRPGLLKMFLDPFHQRAPGAPFDHETTTKWMRYFAREGLKRNPHLRIITTLYGPPPWATRQRILRGRDLDPERRQDLVAYIVDWVNFLSRKEHLPVAFVSLHNEGEDWMRWPADGRSGNIGQGHDYNLFWPPEQVVDFLKLMRPALNQAGLGNVGITPGETSNWYRFSAWGYADAIADDSAALRSLGLITSHGFYNGNYGRWFGEHRSVGTDILRALRPELHAWVTSTSWSRMDADNLKEMQGNIYSAKVNGIIPWAGIQRPAQWVGGDPNPGTAFRIHEDGSWEVLRGYYYYKQISRAGQPGMAVARTSAMDSEIAIIAFSSNGTTNPDAFVIVNIGKGKKKISLRIRGGRSLSFDAYRTADEGDRYTSAGRFDLDENVLVYEAPGRSATTFFGR